MSELALAQGRFDWEEYVSQHGAVLETPGRTDEFLLNCPDCGKLKLAVNVKRRKWRCFTCDDGGVDSLTLVVKVEQTTWRAAVDRVLNGAQRPVGRLDVIPELGSPDERQRAWVPREIPYPEGYTPLDVPGGVSFLGPVQRTWGLNYAGSRGIPWEVICKWKIGACMGGRYNNRLIFPVFDSGGRLIFFQARAMWTPSHGERHIKILSPRRGDPAREAGPSDCLLNLTHVVAAGYKRVLVVEGPVDCAHAWPDVVAIFGKHISWRQIELLMRAGIRELDLGLDPDAWAEMQKTAPQLADLFIIRQVRWPAGVDPGKLSKAEIEYHRSQASVWGAGQWGRLADVRSLEG